MPKIDFPMRGAQVFARACHEEGVKALFRCPGNYEIVHAIADTGIPTYGGRHEGSQCHAADAFCRATGEVAAARTAFETENEEFYQIGLGYTDAANRVVNLMHEVYLHLHAYYPEYLWDNYDVSQD